MISSYIQNLFVQEEPVLQDVHKTILEHHMPNISVSKETGKLLHLLVKLSKAERVLEIGALGGYSGIWMASALNDKGTLTSLEINKNFADVALKNIEKAGLKDKVTYEIGPALDSLHKLKTSNKLFDFFFIDADKENYIAYVDACLAIAKKGAIIAVDNVLWKGEVVKEVRSEKANAMHGFNQYCATHPNLQSLIVPIGDGLMISIVN
ncbi:O-methyltransferase [Bacillus kexueae]|uniref:O-methyltransferase n=1 Tax=Aeribacillus kexueae TaxID=2078952 RepID=UPI0024358466|nr:O-methyltransferase [Bacillus kexueae]